METVLVETSVFNVETQLVLVEKFPCDKEVYVRFVEAPMETMEETRVLDHATPDGTAE
jgi:hypothetical protein